MGKFQDLTGQRFGRLTVLKRGEDYVSPKGHHNLQWECLCDCGNTIVVAAGSLKKGVTKSCGCLQKEQAQNAPFHNLIGQRFGRLTVIERAETHISPSGNHRTRWKCLCDCGNTTIVTASNLKRKTIKSCGCLYNEKAKFASSRDLTGQKFGRLTVLERAEDYISPKGKHLIRWKCLCDCGNTIITRKLGSNVKSCGCLQKEQASKTHLKDLTGQRFGKLTVLERAEDYISPKGYHSVQWKCMCDCGNTSIVRALCLKRGDTKSCGCIESFGEQKVLQILQSKNINCVKEFYFRDLRGPRGGVLRFDFCVRNKEEDSICLIEYQGIQHYPEYDKNKEFGKQQREETDQLKRDYCAAHNIPLYEIAYNEDEEQRVEEILKDLQETHHIDLSTITKDNTVPNESKDLEV